MMQAVLLALGSIDGTITKSLGHTKTLLEFIRLLLLLASYATRIGPNVVALPTASPGPLYVYLVRICAY